MVLSTVYSHVCCSGSWMISPCLRAGRWGSLWMAFPIMWTTTGELQPTSTLAQANPHCKLAWTDSHGFVFFNSHAQCKQTQWQHKITALFKSWVCLQMEDFHACGMFIECSCWMDSEKRCSGLFHSENGPQITYVRDFKAKVQYFRFWCQVRFIWTSRHGIHGIH